MSNRTKTVDMRRQVLKGRKLEKSGKKLVTYDELPSPFHKTPYMKYIELKHGAPLEKLIADGSNREVAAILGINYSTVSKWRKIIWAA